ncbi:hypothetical protein COTS27_01511 [Spirochaetota bacterium]|nr:hypothetical protein COTS27_01511 [Spirochaetota bacterium]
MPHHPLSMSTSPIFSRKPAQVLRNLLQYNLTALLFTHLSSLSPNTMPHLHTKPSKNTDKTSQYRLKQVFSRDLTSLFKHSQQLITISTAYYQQPIIELNDKLFYLK